MTTEANDNDPRVSDTYRALATETTPPDLDSTVLSLAAAAADTRQSGFGLSRAWFRPIAWAATIGLSLAFVLEMSELNDVKEPTVQIDSDEALEERVLGDQAVEELIDSTRRQRQQELDKRTDMAVEVKASPAPTAAEVAPAAGAASVSDDFAAADMLLLQEAEKQARTRSGPAREAVANSSAAALPIKKEQASLCDAAARRTAASWYACIEELRDKSLIEAAAMELEVLFSEFPDFEAPEANR